MTEPEKCRYCNGSGEDDDGTVCPYCWGAGVEDDYLVNIDDLLDDDLLQSTLD